MDVGIGVSDGIRTRDILDHNQVLYRLSYTHHAVHCRIDPTRVDGCIIVACGNSDQKPVRDQTGLSVPRTLSAIALACSLVGPGGATNAVRR